MNEEPIHCETTQKIWKIFFFLPSTSQNHLKCIRLVINSQKRGSKANMWKVPKSKNIKFWSQIRFIQPAAQASAHISHHLTEWRRWQTFRFSLFFQLNFVHLHELKRSHLFHPASTDAKSKSSGP